MANSINEKRCGRAIIVSVSVLALCSILSLSIFSVYAAAVDRTGSVLASGSKPLTPGALLDDFRYAAPINVWSTPTGSFGSASPDPRGYCTASYTTSTGTTSGGNCLKLAYDIRNANSFSGYYSSLGSVSLGSALPGTSVAPTAVSFWIKGDVGGELLKVQLSNSSTTTYTSGAKTYKSNSASVYIPDYLDGKITTAWQKVTIPLHNFANLDGFSSMKEIVFVFENAQSATSGCPPQGNIYIDDIRFDNTAIPVVRIDHFGDKVGSSSVGGNIGMGHGNGALESLNSYSFSSTITEYSPYANSVKLNYNVLTFDEAHPNIGYSYAFFVFGGGNNASPSTETGWIAIPHDFSNYSKLTFRIKAKSLFENPVMIKVELADGYGARAAVIGPISSSTWEVYELSFATSFPLLDKSTIKQLTFVFEEGRIASLFGASKSGVVFIDSIQFEQ